MFRNFFKDAIIYGMSVASAKLLLFLSIPVFTRLMSVEAYGIIGFMGSLIGLIGITMKIGTNNAVQRYYFDVEEMNKKNVISSGLKVLFFFSSIVLLFSLSFVTIFENYFITKNISLTLLSIAIVYIFLLQYIVFVKDIMRLYFKPWIYFCLEITPTLGGVGLALVFVYYFNLDEEGYFLGYALATFIVLIITVFYLKNYFLFKEKTIFKKELLAFGYPFIFVGLASWIFQSADRWMLLELVDAKEVGLYSVAYQISSILLLLVTTFGIVWSPYAMKLLKTKLHKEIYANIGIIWYLLIVYVAFILSIFFNNIIEFVLDERYYSSIEIGILLVITIIFIGTVQISVLGISIAKQTKYLPRITWSIAILNIILNYFLIPEYFALGAAISTLISNFLLTVIYFKYSQKFYYIPYDKVKLVLITLFITLFYLMLFLSDILNYTILYKIVISIMISVFFITWIVLEGKKLIILVNLNET
jgi:O-antigen/teichoic acid export membrane protein